MNGPICFLVGLALGVYVIPVSYRVWDWFDETAINWWYNRKRSR